MLYFVSLVFGSLSGSYGVICSYIIIRIFLLARLTRDIALSLFLLFSVVEISPIDARNVYKLVLFCYMAIFKCSKPSC